MPAGRTEKTVGSKDLLPRTVFYKVGHHGSHNATLREKGLELMTSDELAAMLPVERTTAAKQEWAMPFGSLFTRLRERTRGRILDRDDDRVKRGDEGLLDDAEWAAFEGRTKVEEDFIDYRIDP